MLQGGLSINYSDNYYLLSQRHADVPRLTQQHHEAMALFNEIASSDELRLDAMLQPGDIQLLNNHTQLHTRSKFEDFPVSFHCPPTPITGSVHSCIVASNMAQMRIWVDYYGSCGCMLAHA